MAKDYTIVHNFVTVTKRFPLKARCVVALSLIIVIFELASGFIELNSQSAGNPKIAKLLVKPNGGKIRERKEIKLEEMHHGLEEYSQNSLDEMKDAYNMATNVLGKENDNLDRLIQLNKDDNDVETSEYISANVRLKFKGDNTAGSINQNSTTTSAPVKLV